MTKLQTRKTKLVIETSVEVRYRRAYRPIILDVQRGGCLVRPKGTRTAFSISYQTIYETAAKIAAAQAKAAKLAQKKAAS